MGNWIKDLVKTIFLANRNKPLEFYSTLPVEENIKLTTEDNETIWGLLIKPESVDITPETRCFVICHGKGIDRVDALRLAKLRSRLPNAGNACFFMIDYRNFGASTGEFNMKGVNYDVDAAVQYLRKRYNPKSIDLVGHSMGGGVILEYCGFLARKLKEGTLDYKPGAVYCFATFTSLLERLREIRIYRWIHRIIPAIQALLPGDFGYDNMANLNAVKELGAKLYLFHGKRDVVISHTHSELLGTTFGPDAILMLTEDGHDSLFGNKSCWDVILTAESLLN